MNKIIEMAREAGIIHPEMVDKTLERFAELVRADERETWEHKYARLQSLMEIRETQPNKPCCLAEREACAKVCEHEWSNTAEREFGEECAAAIRARGNT